MASHSALSPHRVRLHDDQAREFLSRHGYLPVPTLVQWMATLRCSLQCEHCLAGGMHGRQADMALRDAMGLIDQVADMGVGEFLITGGEPLLREDMAEIIGHLGRRRVRYSINTAIAPSAELREAMNACPPAFVAVSVDGPREVHDRFRGRAGSFDQAMESIRYFAGLPGCCVAAGTTVTSHNIAHLAETFHIVTQSEAQRWGIHLLVPEGRAAERRDLFLSRRQLRGVLDFVARRRNYFPITMADEIGYCGEMEPLLRDEPFRCGAGRAQCVVLPSGEVVPCTTLDESTSAGNVRERALAEIWRTGFAELRKWEPRGRCIACVFSVACEGGCWLQRRKGTHCFKDVWQGRGLARSTAGLAICLGLLGNASPVGAAPPATATAPGDSDLAVRGLAESGLELQILGWYAQQVGGGRELPPEAPAEPQSDPGFEFLAKMRDGKLPADLDGLSRAIAGSFETRQRSLGQIALTWRAVSEWCMKNPAEGRSADQRKMLTSTLAMIEKTAVAWRNEILQKKLDPYLLRGRTPEHFMLSKRGPSPWQRLQYDMGVKRWGRSEVREHAPMQMENPQAYMAQLQAATEEFVRHHPYAESMRLAIHADRPVVCHNAGGDTAIKGDGEVGIFDLLSADAAAGVTLTWPGEPKRSYQIQLPAGVQATYIDLLVMAYRQNTGAMDDVISGKAPGGSPVHTWQQPNPLLLEAVMHFEKQRPAKEREGSMMYWVAEFWMF